MGFIRRTAAVATAAGATLLLFSGAAQAYTLDAAGSGFVGKGEVQTPFGWNNAKLQSNAAGVTFSYRTAEEYTAICTFITGEGTRGEKVHNVPRELVSSVNAKVAYDTRVRNQITGFTLTGFGETTSIGAVPAVGGTCAGGGGLDDGTWTSVELTSSQGGLYAYYGTASTLLVPTVL
ncbi:hypothetical protein ACIRG5_24185 [Lentzea sp. NPDC102401]|uniref:hypothetical protein n=1 Tax=Lentzea sp. NPDC102401 TaxID=3364128 RepID=UPI00382675F4